MGSRRTIPLACRVVTLGLLVSPGASTAGADTYAVWSVERLADAPTSRLGNGISEIVGGRLFLIGGNEGSPGTGRINEAYDIASDTWSTGSAYPHSDGRQSMGSAVVDGLIYTFCGVNIWGTYGTTDDDYYDPGTDTWATGQGVYPLSLAGGPACVALDGYVYCMGGNSYDGTFYPNVAETRARNVWL